jgi:hypothetical protein
MGAAKCRKHVSKELRLVRWGSRKRHNGHLCGPREHLTMQFLITVASGGGREYLWVPEVWIIEFRLTTIAGLTLHSIGQGVP